MRIIGFIRVGHKAIDHGGVDAVVRKSVPMTWASGFPLLADKVDGQLAVSAGIPKPWPPECPGCGAWLSRRRPPQRRPPAAAMYALSRPRMFCSS